MSDASRAPTELDKSASDDAVTAVVSLYQKQEKIYPAQR